MRLATVFAIFVSISIAFLMLAPVRSESQSVQSPVAQQISVLEAVQSTLRNHPLLRSQQAQVELANGELQQSAGQFDTTINGGLSQNRNVNPLTMTQQNQNALLGIAGSVENTELTTANFGVSKEFRNGITLAPTFQIIRNVDNLLNPQGVNTANMTLLVTLPLLRGRGRTIVAAQEIANRTEVSATLLDLNQLMSQLIANTSASYWQLVAAKDNLGIARDAEERARVDVEDVRALIQGDERPRDDLNVVTANLAQRTSARIAAEQALTVARSQLALDMGMRTEEVPQAVLDPAQSFPESEDQHLPSDAESSVRYYINQALLHRADYRASQQRTEERNVLLKATRNQLLPALNLTLGTGYSSLQEGRKLGNLIDAATAGAQGPTAAAGITFSFPPANDVARGLVRQADAVRVQSEMQSNNLARNITASVIDAARAVRNSWLQVKHSQESVNAFRSSLEGQKDRYRGGIGSIVDILTVEDRLDTALFNLVQAQLSYGLAVTQFRFVTGTFIAPDQSTQSIDALDLVTPPFAAASQPGPTHP